MTTPKPNRFSVRRQVVNVGGFDLVRYGSLQKREREYLLEIKRKLFDRTSAYLELGSKIAKDLAITEQEAWEALNSGGSNVDEYTRLKLLPHFVEVKRRLDPNYPHLQYPTELVVAILMSRLESLKEIAADLDDAFGISFTKQQIADFDKVPNCDRLTSPIREQISRQITNNLTENTFDEVVAFAVGEESQWKTPEEGEAEEADGNDPLSSKVS